MLSRLVEQRDAVSLVLTSVTTVKNLSAQQWATAADLTTTLRPFLNVTEIMSASSYPTLSMVIPVLDGLRHLLSTSTGGLDVLRSLLVRELEERFGSAFDDDELCVATTVDPCFKLAPFDTDERREKTTAAVMDAMRRASPTAADEQQAPDTSAATASTGPVSIWDKLDSGIRSAAQQTRSDGVQRELQANLAGANIDRRQCPLEGWGLHKNAFPTVAIVARRLLGIPATSVASERLFSKAGDVITKKRNRLAPGKAEQLVLLMENL